MNVAKQLIYPRRQINHKYINRSIQKWLDIHFGDTSFNGRVVIGHRKRAGGIYALRAPLLTELPQYVKLMHISSRLDYYITANTVKRTKRLKEDLFGLQNIVIDVDCHDDGMLGDVNALVEEFIWRSQRDLWGTNAIPSPNSIVRTGRGIQLWWAIKPCYGGNEYGVSLRAHEKIKGILISHIEAMLEDYSETLEGLRVDTGASSSLVGYFRLPCTYNTKAKRYSSLEILHSERYDQRELIKIEGPELEKTANYKSLWAKKHIPMQETDREMLQNFQSGAVRRVMQLINLRNLRNNDVGAETRNDFNFAVYNALRMSFDHSEAMTRLNAYNAGFKKPMTKSELNSCVSSAKGYKYLLKNENLIKLLKITEEEQEAIGLLPFRTRSLSKPNASRDAVRKALKDDRNMKILEMSERGIAQAEIARILGIGKNTVYRALKKMREEMPPEPEIIEIYDEEERHQNGSIYVLKNIQTHGISNYTNTAGGSRGLPGGLFAMLNWDNSS